MIDPVTVLPGERVSGLFGNILKLASAPNSYPAPPPTPASGSRAPGPDVTTITDPKSESSLKVTSNSADAVSIGAVRAARLSAAGFHLNRIGIFGPGYRVVPGWAERQGRRPLIIEYKTGYRNVAGKR